MLNVILALGVLGAAAASRVIRGATISIIQHQYIEAARAVGAGHLRIMCRYVFPNVTATIIILATIGLGGAILAESALSFLGFGVPPPYPSWGAMLSGSGRSYMYTAPWMAIWPGRGDLAGGLRLQHAGRRATRPPRPPPPRRRRRAAALNHRSATPRVAIASL